MEDKIEFVVGDFFKVLPELQKRVEIDVVFLSPPWGGPGYIDKPRFRLEWIEPGLREMVLAARRVTPNIGLFLPRNTCVDDVLALCRRPCGRAPTTAAATVAQGVGATPSGTDMEGQHTEPIAEWVEVEHNYLNRKLKTMTVYCGPMWAPVEKSTPAATAAGVIT